jgi:glycosyltransferase involved in cell wall biosynthesis
MVIVVYANLKTYSSSDPYFYFVKNLISNLAHTYSEDDFYIIAAGFSNEFEDKAINLYTISIKVRPGFFTNFFLNKKLAGEIRRLKADVALSFDAIVKTPIPQSLFIKNVGMLQRFRFSSLQKLKTVFCLSQAEKSELINQYKIDDRRIQVVYGNSIIIIEPFADPEKTVTKEKYTDSKEYFLYRGIIKPEQNIISLLKAFSIFKKRQKSNMKLVLAGKIEWEETAFSKLINTYKYRDDVIFIDNIDEQKTIPLIASAFAFIQPYIDNSLSFAWEAIEAEVPVLINKNTPFAEVASGAALYFDGAKSDDMADKLMHIYKDEALREELIKKGKEVLTKNNGTTIKLVGERLKQTGY